jgi:hypothetical protein
MPEAQSVICDICHRTCGSGPGLASHVRSMHPVDWRIQQEAKATPSRGARPLVPVPSVPPPSPAAANGIVWEEPPKRGRRARLVDELTPIVVELRRNPGRWARLREFGAKGSASASRKPIGVAFPDLELRSASTANGSAIWARYVEEA